MQMTDRGEMAERARPRGRKRSGEPQVSSGAVAARCVEAEANKRERVREKERGKVGAERRCSRQGSRQRRRRRGRTYIYTDMPCDTRIYIYICQWRSAGGSPGADFGVELRRPEELCELRGLEGPEVSYRFLFP
jgi:hypothetical protein